MAQSLAVAGPAPGRISQILPTVKCSTCNQPVPISELGEHVCAAPPSMPAAATKAPMSPTSATFFQQKYQKLISSQNTNPPPSSQPTQVPPRSASVPPRQGTPLSVQRGLSPAPSSHRSSQASSHSSRQLSVASVDAQGRPERVPSPLARAATPETSLVAFPSRPDSAASTSAGSTSRAGPSTYAPRAPSPLSPLSPLSPRHHPSEPTPASAPVTAPSRTSSEPARYMSPGPMPMTAPPHMQSMRTPSVASMRAPAPAVRPPALSNPAPPMAGLPAADTAPLRPRASTSTRGPSPEPSVIYSTAHPQAGPSRGPQLNLSINVGPGAYLPGQQPSTPVGGLMSPQGHVEIDTKTGGEAGMAGVGRRGFAAAARAAMFANQMGAYGSPQSEHPPFHLQGPGLDGRRANAPRFLDIVSANQYNPSATPPLSPGSSNSAHSPRSGGSPLSASIPSPRDGRASITPTQPAIARTPSPFERGSILLRDRVLPPQADPPKVPLPATPSTPSLPFFEKFKNKIPPVDTASTTPQPYSAGPSSAGPSPLSPAESEFEGLAYADDDDGDSDARTTVRGSTAVPPGRVRFPSMSAARRESAKSLSKYSSSSSDSSSGGDAGDAGSPRVPMVARSLSQSTSYTVRSAAKSTGALDRAMETLFEEEAAADDAGVGASSPTASSVSSPAMFPAPLASGGDAQRESLRPKLPVRSRTSPGLGPARPEAKRRAPKVRACLKCEKPIDDGRWIQMEGGGIMCDRCWKNMYLPKCRRCNLTIERHAVSSSDGQLKGKYHRDCFNCHTCHKPFPDKTFYVFDGRPYCAYHYHEVNNSLCAAATCGQPIEGPCAVSSSGDRYHPEHFLCEHPRCAERLVEYWEVDGRMFCDKHAAGVVDSDDDDAFAPPRREQRHRDSDGLRATKRKTVFIDLAGGPPGS